jgi:hypothetical protein
MANGAAKWPGEPFHRSLTQAGGCEKRGAADTETRQSPSVTLSVAAPFLIDRQIKHDQGEEKGKDLFPLEDDLLLSYRLLRRRFTALSNDAVTP